MVIDDMISTGHARALLGIDDQEKQYTTAQKIFDEKLSVRETEKLVKKIQQEKDQPEAKEEVKIDPKMEAICRDLEEKMKVILGTKPSIRRITRRAGSKLNIILWMNLTVSWICLDPSENRQSKILIKVISE